MTESRKIVWKETAIVAVGVAICTALMVGIFALLGYFDMSVLLGGLVGATIAVVNFLVLAIVATLAADKAEQQDVAGGQKLIKASYPVRLLVLAVVLFACAKSGVFNVIALVLPMVFVRPALTLAEFFKKKGG